MYGGLLLFKKNHCIGWGLVTLWNVVQRCEIEWDLVVGAAQRRKRNSPPTPGDWTVDMTEKQIANVVVAGQNIANLCAIGTKANAIDAGYSDIKRRMVHEKVDGFVARIIEEAAQPVDPAIAI